MAEAIMVAGTLTQEMIGAGKQLTQSLDSRLTVEASLWLLLEDTKAWRLLFCIPLADQLGPKRVYSTIQSTLLRPDVRPFKMSLSDISIVSRTHPLLQQLRIVFHTGAGISGIRFSRNTINGHFIEDAYIYRMNIGAQQSGRQVK